MLLPRSGPGVRGPDLAARLRRAAPRPALVLTTKVVLGVSAGHAVHPAATAGRAAALADELLRRTDVALYKAKAERGGCATWDSELDRGLHERLELLSQLRVALTARDQLQTWYQPKADPHTGQVTAYEALVRWQHPQRGLLLPGVFLPAGGAGRAAAGAHPAGAGALDRLPRRGARLGPVGARRGQPVGARPAGPRAAAPGRGLLARHGVPPHHLRLEVTETVVMSDPDTIISTLLGLRALGVGLSLDDYGTGLSSLGYLRVLPVDELKIDRSFVRDLLTDSACALIVASTIGLAHDLQLRVVAEGVEDQPTLEALALAGCDAVQGWHTGRPGPAAAARRALLTNAPSARGPRSARPVALPTQPGSGDLAAHGA